MLYRHTCITLMRVNKRKTECEGKGKRGKNKFILGRKIKSGKERKKGRFMSWYEKERDRKEEERRRRRERKERVPIKFNLNQPSFMNIERISDTSRHKLDTCTWLSLSLSFSSFRSFALSLSRSLSLALCFPLILTVVLASIHSRCLPAPLSLRPRCLFTSWLFYFCHAPAHPRVYHLFRSNDRSSRQSISSRMRLEY